MENKPLVSIITITRNRASLIHRCIESIQNQTYTNYEHIIVDGASTDNTKQVVEAYNDPHIKFIELEKNYSLPETWEIALSKYSGEYLTFLDDDDEYYPEKIEKQVKFMTQLPSDYGMIYCWMDYFDTQTGKKISTHAAKLRGGNIMKQVLASPQVCGTPSLFLRRGLWEMCIAKSKEDAIISDWLFGARICKQYKVDYLPESLIKVYVNHGFTRMSDNGYYANVLNKTINFHNRFLNEFEDDFERYPSSRALHYNNICNSYVRLGDLKNGFKYYILLLRSNLSLRNLAYFPYLLFNKIKRK